MSVWVVTVKGFKSCQHFSVWVWSQVEFFSIVKTQVFECCHDLSFEYCHYLSFWVLLKLFIIFFLLIFSLKKLFKKKKHFYRPTDRQTPQPTTKLIELLRAAKTYDFGCFVGATLKILSKCVLHSSYGLECTGEIWHLTCNTWHLTPDTWHQTFDTGGTGRCEHCVKISGPCSNGYRVKMVWRLGRKGSLI